VGGGVLLWVGVGESVKLGPRVKVCVAVAVAEGVASQLRSGWRSGLRSESGSRLRSVTGCRSV